MNVDLFYSKAALNGDRKNKAIASRINVTEGTVLNKINGITKWTADEIALLVYAWNLTAQEVYDIWFKDATNVEGCGSSETIGSE